MEKEEFHAVIKHFYLKKWSAAKIKAELDEVRADAAPTLKTVYFWINKFKRGRMSTKDEARPGRPVEATAQKMIEKIYRIIMEVRRIKVHEIVEIVEIVEISVHAVHNILHKKLKMKTMYAQCVPRLLTIYQKRTRKGISEQCLTTLKRILQDF